VRRSIDPLRHAACALSLLLSTVADAQGLRDYAEASLGQRLSLTAAERHQARQVLLTRGVIAYHRPRYQVFALDAARPAAPASAAPGAADEEAVDIEAVVTRIWAVLS